MKELVLNNTTPVESVGSAVKGHTKVTIDCGVMEMTGETLNRMMKAARAKGVTEFKLINVCGQDLIGTGVQGPAKIDVYGIMGNHSAAFIDQIELNTYPTLFPNNIICPGDAQVAIGNTSNPTEMNIGGSVDDLFASYCPSGIFRVAGQGGNRCGLRAGAGIPHIWREIDYSEFEDMSDKEIAQDLLYKYQLRKARLNKIGFKNILQEFKKKVIDREPPIIMFGRRVRDYFMEYAQGTIGIIVNIYDVPNPAGYYICSGMTAGTAFIRGQISKDQLGVNVKFGKLNDNDREFLGKQLEGFFKTFDSRVDLGQYMQHLSATAERFNNSRDDMLDTFTKIVPIDMEDKDADYKGIRPTAPFPNPEL